MIMVPSIVISTSSPKFVTYINTLSGWWGTPVLEAIGVPGYSKNNVYNVINLAFLDSKMTPLDALIPWVQPQNYFGMTVMKQITGLSNPSDDEFRTSIKKLYKQANIKLFVSLFGATDEPIRNNKDPESLGKNIGEFVTKYQFDGVDVDWEESHYFETGDGRGEMWLEKLTISMKNNMASDILITHAPQAPYFMGNTLNKYPKGAYLYIENTVGQYIDWYNVQFYNQQTTTYSTFESLFVKADGWSQNTAV